MSKNQAVCSESRSSWDQVVDGGQRKRESSLGWEYYRTSFSHMTIVEIICKEAVKRYTLRLSLLKNIITANYSYFFSKGD